MKLSKGYWVHRDSMDMFIEVTKVQYRGPKYIKIKYIPWNRNEHGNPFPMYHQMKATIMVSELSNWTRHNI